MKWFRDPREKEYESYNFCPGDTPCDEEETIALLDHTEVGWQLFRYGDMARSEPWIGVSDEQARWILAHPDEFGMEDIL